jgi:hypothetical protein
MEVCEAKRPCELESYNAELRKPMAEMHLDMHALKSVHGDRTRFGYEYGHVSEGVTVHSLAQLALAV